jgi:hypothetical protein
MRSPELLGVRCLWLADVSFEAARPGAAPDVTETAA